LIDNVVRERLGKNAEENDDGSHGQQPRLATVGSDDDLNPLVKTCLGETFVRRVPVAHRTNGAQISHMLKEDRPSVRQSYWFCLLRDERWNDASSA